MLDKLKKILNEIIDMKDIEISEETALSTDLGLSSLDYFELINQLEEEFSIEVSDNELLEIKTIGDLIRCIENNQ